MTATNKASETKECGLCKCTIYREDRDSQKWGKMRYCSQRCSALHRGVLIGGWRNEKKECKVCGTMFGARPGITKGCWRRLKCCSDDCIKQAQTGRRKCVDRPGPAYRMIRVAIDSAGCSTPSQRLRFLRLSKSPGGGKSPIGVEEMARIAQIGHSTLSRIEAGDPSVPFKCIEKLCGALKIPFDMLRWSDKKWARVVSSIGLTATEFKKTES